MKYLSIVFAASAATLLIVGCDRASNIAGPQRSPTSRPVSDAIIQRTNEQDVPWSDVEQDPCTGDWVTIQGSTHFLYNTSFDGNTGYHLYTRSNHTGTGTGAPSGYIYKVMDEFFYHENNPTGPQFEQTQGDDLHILGPKSVDNYIKHMEFKLVMNGVGNVTASRDRSWTKCVG
jgi:hypothetical protein